MHCFPTICETMNLIPFPTKLICQDRLSSLMLSILATFCCERAAHSQNGCLCSAFATNALKGYISWHVRIDCRGTWKKGSNQFVFRERGGLGLQLTRTPKGVFGDSEASYAAQGPPGGFGASQEVLGRSRETHSMDSNL